MTVSSSKILINEVGMRDGLQNQSTQISTANKLKLAEALLAAGVQFMEVTSFVHPKAVPQMADAEAILAGLPAVDCVYTTLVPNLNGYQRAVASGVKSVAVVLTATDEFNQKNINMSLQKAIDSCFAVIKAAKQDGIFVRGYVSAACACPYTGKVEPQQIFELTEKLITAGADEISIADTIGAGNPQQLLDVLEPLIEKYGAEIFNVHLHDTRGQALAMAWAAVSAGIRKFDSSIGGLGGCPFAPGASGNLATEDLVFMLEECGFNTGISLEKLRHAISVAEEITGLKLGGKISPWLHSQDQKNKLIAQFKQ